VGVTEIGADASRPTADETGNFIVTVRPWYSMTAPEPGAPGLLRQPLAEITVRITIEGDQPPRDRVTADVTALVLENDVWISVVPEEADRAALWQALAWE
jgi:hypothetical protein